MAVNIRWIETNFDGRVLKDLMARINKMDQIEIKIVSLYRDGVLPDGTDFRRDTDAKESILTRMIEEYEIELTAFGDFVSRWTGSFP